MRKFKDTTFATIMIYAIVSGREKVMSSCKGGSQTTIAYIIKLGQNL